MTMSATNTSVNTKPVNLGPGLHLSPANRRVLVEVARAIRDTGETPTYRELTVRTGLTMATLCWHLGRLVELGLLDKPRRTVCARNYLLTPKGQDAVREDVPRPRCPHCGGEL